MIGVNIVKFVACNEGVMRLIYRLSTINYAGGIPNILGAENFGYLLFNQLQKRRKILNSPVNMFLYRSLPRNTQ